MIIDLTTATEMTKMRNKAIFLFATVSVLLFTNINASQTIRFTIEPSNIVVSEGSSILLPCEGEITHTNTDHLLTKRKFNKNRLDLLPNIRWRGPDGQDIGIVGDTFRTQLENGSLYISSVEENRGLTGAYQCLLSSDGIGTIVSRSAIVSISKLPETNNLFEELHLYPGQTAYIKCLASPATSDLGKYHVQWFKDDMPLRLDDTRMVLFPSGAIEIDELVAADKGTYQCNVTSGTFYTHSSKTNLNIKAGGEPQQFQAPTFLTESTSKTVNEGETVTLDCVANGNPKPQIKWLRNGEDIEVSDSNPRYRIIGTGSLQIISIGETDAGNYQCRASNSMESADIEISLLVQVPPKFIQNPTDRIAYEKDELEMVCAIRGKPTPIVQWLKNGDVITPNDYMQIVNGHNLRILGLIETDAGMFQCIGHNSAGSVQAAARLEIATPRKKGKKAKENHMKNKPIMSSTTEVIVADSPIHTAASKVATGPKLPTNSIPKSIFNSLQSKDKLSSDEELNSEDYDQNGDDYDDEDEGTIHQIDPNVNLNTLLHSLTQKENEKTEQINRKSTIVADKTNAIKQSTDLSIEHLDGDSNLKALIPGPPRDLVAQLVNRYVTLSWMEPAKNPDEVISYTVFYKMTSSERERKLTTKSRDEQTAIIQSVLPGKTYHFRVVGNSNHGPGESSNVFELTTQPDENIAGAVRNIVGQALSHKEIHVRWTPPLISNGNISKYRIYYTEPDGVDMYVDGLGTETESTLTELHPFTEYSIYVVPFNGNGMGDSSNEITVKTFSSEPSESPLNVTLEATSSTSITVRWQPPPPEEQNGQITGYKIRYRKQKKHVQVETTPANVRHYELLGLDKKSVYQVKIAAMTVNGTGPFTEWSSIETYESDLTETHVPGRPTITNTRATSSSISISWSPPKQQEIKVRNYILGFGIGFPDVETRVLDEKLRFYEIKNLESNSEYVLSLRARNLAGDGEPTYYNIQTRDEDPIESGGYVPEVPVRLRAITMSATSIVVYWTDNSVIRAPHTSSSRFYTVRYNIVDTTRYKYYNTTEMNCMIDDLRPNTQYEFAVKAVKGRRESPWSMSEVNTTFSLSPVSPPRDLSAQPDPTNPQTVVLKWLPPRNNNGHISGYLVYYTTDSSSRDRDWSVEPVNTDTSLKIKNLKQNTMYYFKVQTQNVNRAQQGTFSAMISYKTGNLVSLSSPTNQNPNMNEDLKMPSSGGLASLIINEYLIYIIAGVMVITLLISIKVVMILCRRKPQGTPDGKHIYNKGTSNQPPDLWIHHDQMELKNVEKNPTNDGASSSGAMTLPRTGHEYETDLSHTHITNSLDKRQYVPGYMSTSMNSTIDRSHYPRTYNRMLIDPNSSQQNLINQTQMTTIPQTPENPYSYDSMPSNYSDPSITYAQGLSIDVPKAPRGQGHPLQSFSVPGPPPSSLNTTPLISNPNKHNVPAVAIRPQNASPYKKSLTNSTGSSIAPISLSNTLTNRLQQSGPMVAHSSDEIQRLAPSTSTEELNQEMANLEGLMKDLNNTMKNITASEFEC
ncbi:neogenin isoform X2 [Sitodiplosis mosellana]|uniref:neogenin isoform X2 n=1 Tax=Sitodiplosis mosellana TaxID=263140 RepID=UPI002443EC2E|nr:neogenin isoform X2 [Sitodiplosis mosellana]